jgi:hypothetical protein
VVAYGALPDLVKRKGEPEQKTRLSEIVWDLVRAAVQTDASW